MACIVWPREQLTALSCQESPARVLSSAEPRPRDSEKLHLRSKVGLGAI